MSDKKFVTAINCMDGRTQLPVIEWMKREYDADFVDMITEPGPDKILSDPSHELAGSIKDRMEISVMKHQSETIAIVAHGDCAGNPVTKEEHLNMLRDAMKTVAAWGYSVSIVGLWIDGEKWQVARVDEVRG